MTENRGFVPTDGVSTKGTQDRLLVSLGQDVLLITRTQ
jgi:hypothetical protein